MRNAHAVNNLTQLRWKRAWWNRQVRSHRLRREIHACRFWHVYWRRGPHWLVECFGGWLTTRTWPPRALADALLVGATASARGIPSLEGAGRHERERRAGETSGREAHDELVDDDGLRVQRWANLVSAASAVTNCVQRTWPSSFLEKTWNISVSQQIWISARIFWKHAESRSGILECDGRAVLRVVAYWVGGMQIFVKTLTRKSGIRALWGVSAKPGRLFFGSPRRRGGESTPGVIKTQMAPPGRRQKVPQRGDSPTRGQHPQPRFRCVPQWRRRSQLDRRTRSWSKTGLKHCAVSEGRSVAGLLMGHVGNVLRVTLLARTRMSTRVVSTAGTTRARINGAIGARVWDGPMCCLLAGGLHPDQHPECHRV